MDRRRDAQGEPSEAIPTVKYVDCSEYRLSLPQLPTPPTDYQDSTNNNDFDDNDQTWPRNLLHGTVWSDMSPLLMDR
jgi:hypothetical protein